MGRKLESWARGVSRARELGAGGARERMRREIGAREMGGVGQERERRVMEWGEERERDKRVG